MTAKDKQNKRVTLVRGEETRVVENASDLARAKYDGFREKKSKGSSSNSGSGSGGSSSTK